MFREYRMVYKSRPRCHLVSNMGDSESRTATVGRYHVNSRKISFQFRHPEKERPRYVAEATTSLTLGGNS